VSLPARETERWAPPPRRRAPALRPAARPPFPGPPHPGRRARRGPSPAFSVLTLVVVSVLVVGLVALNAMRIDAAYETRSLTERIGLLSDARETLVNDVARLSSPSRIGAWALDRGFVHPAPGAVVILQVPGTAADVGAGE
jgi:hypothetical protein